MSLEKLKRHELPLFFLLSLLISWGVWLPQAIVKVTDPAASSASSSPMNFLAVWGPGLAAAVVSLLVSGRSGLGALLRPLRLWRVNALRYLAVLLYPAVLKLAAFGIDRLFGRSYPLVLLPIARFFDPAQAAMMVPAAFIAAAPNALGEELGWRGFAVPRLQERLQPLAAAILLGIFWAVWHLPMWIATSGRAGVHELASGLDIVGAAILFSWVYNRTRGSLLPVWLFHFSMTVTGYSLSGIPTATDEMLGWAVIVIVVLSAGRRLGGA